MEKRGVDEIVNPRVKEKDLYKKDVVNSYSTYIVPTNGELLVSHVKDSYSIKEYIEVWYQE